MTFRSLAVPLPFTLSCPRCKGHNMSPMWPLPQPTRGGAERPTLGSTTLPAGEERARRPRAKVRCLGPRRKSVAWSKNSLKGTARKCRERWRDSREMWLLLAGREPQRWACGSCVRPALCSELASDLRPEGFGRQGCGRRRQHCKAFRISVKRSGKAQPPRLIDGKTGLLTR